MLEPLVICHACGIGCCGWVTHAVVVFLKNYDDCGKLRAEGIIRARAS